MLTSPVLAELTFYLCLHLISSINYYFWDNKAFSEFFRALDEIQKEVFIRICVYHFLSQEGVQYVAFILRKLFSIFKNLGCQ